MVETRLTGRKMHVVHIAAHVGGGVGSVLKDFFLLSKEHGIVNDLFCLDRCDSNFRELKGVETRLDELSYDSSDPLFSKVLSRCDIVLLHYWNHPLTAKFLSEVRLPPCRLLVWSHNSGLHEPHVIPTYLTQMAQKILFTSRCSLHAPNLKSLIKREPEKFGVVHSTRSLDKFQQIGRKRARQTAGKNLLYVGTVSKAKMHPESARIFSELSKQGYTIRVVGGPEHEELAAEVSLLGGKIEVFGTVHNVSDFYRNADVFIYPLHSDHYGTGEQVMLEAMAAGLPIVAFNNPAEEVILEGGGGILVSTHNEFIDSTSNLLNNSKVLQDISRQSLVRVESEFSAKIMVEKIIRFCVDLLGYEKASSTLSMHQDISMDALTLYARNSFFDDDVFECIVQNPQDAADIVFSKIVTQMNNQQNASRWLDESKSTPIHYLRYIEDSIPLREVAKKIRN